RSEPMGHGRPPPRTVRTRSASTAGSPRARCLRRGIRVRRARPAAPAPSTSPATPGAARAPPAAHRAILPPGTAPGPAAGGVGGGLVHRPDDVAERQRRVLVLPEEQQRRIGFGEGGGRGRGERQQGAGQPGQGGRETADGPDVVHDGLLSSGGFAAGRRVPAGGFLWAGPGSGGWARPGAGGVRVAGRAMGAGGPRGGGRGGG